MKKLTAVLLASALALAACAAPGAASTPLATSTGVTSQHPAAAPTAGPHTGRLPAPRSQPRLPPNTSGAHRRHRGAVR